MQISNVYTSIDSSQNAPSFIFCVQLYNMKRLATNRRNVKWPRYRLCRFMQISRRHVTSPRFCCYGNGFHWKTVAKWKMASGWWTSPITWSFAASANLQIAHGQIRYANEVVGWLVTSQLSNCINTDAIPKDLVRSIEQFLWDRIARRRIQLRWNKNRFNSIKIHQTIGSSSNLSHMYSRMCRIITPIFISKFKLQRL